MSVFGTRENTNNFIGSALIYTLCSTLHYQKISLRTLLPLKKINEGLGLKVTFDKAVGSDLCIVRLRLSFGLFLSRNGLCFSILSYFSAFVFVFEWRLCHIAWNNVLTTFLLFYFPNGNCYIFLLNGLFLSLSQVYLHLTIFIFLTMVLISIELRGVAPYSFDSIRIQFMSPSVLGP